MMNIDCVADFCDIVRQSSAYKRSRSDMSDTTYRDQAIKQQVTKQVYTDILVEKLNNNKLQWFIDDMRKYADSQPKFTIDKIKNFDLIWKLLLDQIFEQQPDAQCHQSNARCRQSSSQSDNESTYNFDSGLCAFDIQLSK